MKSGGKCRIVSGSQEVIGSIPICSTQIIKGLQILEFVTLSFLPDFCQNAVNKPDDAYQFIGFFFSTNRIFYK
jgi:hypothetical protein